MSETTMTGSAASASPSDEDAIIRVRGLTTRFGPQVVHDGLDLTVRKGEVLGVVGGSGTGKSVLMRTIIGLNQAAAGTIAVFGQVRGKLEPAGGRAREQRGGVLLQGGALFSSRPVAENVQAPMREHADLPRALMDELAGLKIAIVGLPHDACAKFPSELSGGMRKRAGLARALALDPEIVFLDEPTAGLDPVGAAAFDILIRELSDTLGLTVVMITHDLDSLYAICDRVAVLAERKVLTVAPIAELERNPHPWLQSYFHGPRARAARQARQ